MIKRHIVKIRKSIKPNGKINKNYTKYVWWSCFSNFVSSIECVLSTHSMLSVVGQSSTELNLSINYIGKDIVGQLGGLWYMSKFSKKADKEPKKFMKNSLYIQQVAILMECSTPLIHMGLFIPIAGVANISQNISATGLGAINAKIIQKLSDGDNVGEIYAKISVLNTLSCSCGMGVGLIITGCIPDHYYRFSILPIFVFLRLYSYNKAVESLIE